MAKTINQSITLKGSAHKIYETLMDSARHSEMTGSEASVSREVGGKFSAFGGAISGENVELIPDKKIVQKWRAGDWADGHYSTATFELKETDGATELVFTQSEVPDDKFEDISEGWHENYWKKLEAMFK